MIQAVWPFVGGKNSEKRAQMVYDFITEVLNGEKHDGSEPRP
jgi:hypothetical protein